MIIIAWILMVIGGMGFLGNITSGNGTTATTLLAIAFMSAGYHLRKKAKKSKQ